MGATRAEFKGTEVPSLTKSKLKKCRIVLILFVSQGSEVA